MDNTNDPVGVLRETYITYMACPTLRNYDALLEAIPSILNATPAAIQHSEQRETVPAAAVLSISWPMPRYRMETGYMQPDERGSWCKWIDVHPNMDSPHVAAPVPEAKAEQVTDANEICQLPPDGWYCTRKAGHDGPCAAHEHEPDRELDSDDYACIAQGMERLKASEHTMVVKVERNRVWIVRGVQSFMLAYEADTQQELEWYAAKLSGALSIFTPGVKSATPAAPAVKHEASELPVPVTCQIYGHVVGHCGECNLGADDDINATNAVLADNYRKLTLAPPIAVQGSEDARTLERWWLKADGISDTFVRLSDVEKLLDSRSPVAAAPEEIVEANREGWAEGMQEAQELLAKEIECAAHFHVLYAACQKLIDYCDANPPMGESLWCVQEIRAALSAAAPSTDSAADARDAALWIALTADIASESCKAYCFIDDMGDWQDRNRALIDAKHAELWRKLNTDAETLRECRSLLDGLTDWKRAHAASLPQTKEE